MSINLGELRAKITVATSEAMGDVEKFQNKLEATSDVMEEVGSRLLKVGTVGVGAIGALALAGSKWDAQVAGTQFLFNNLDKAVQKNIQSNLKNAESIGLTSQQYKDGATSISTYYKNMGLTSTEISNMSAKTMELVADLGAVVDMPFDEALGRFKSGLMGNYEALDIFGISISASSLENSKFVKSLGKTWNKLSDNEKMLAVYNEILRQSASTQGLAKQEASQFAMQLQLMKTEFKETAGTIGQTLLPILQPLISMLREGMKAVREWVEEHPKLTGVLLASVGAVSALAVVIGGVTLAVAGAISTFLFWQTILAPIVGFLKMKLVGALASTALNFGMLTMGVGGATSGFLAFAGGLPIIGGLVRGITGGISLLLTGLLGLTPAGVIGLVIKGFRLFSLAMLLTGGDIDGFAKKVVDGLKNALDFLVQNIPQWIEAGKEILVGLVKGITENLPLIMQKAGEIMKSLMDGIKQALPLILQAGIEILKAIGQGIVTGLPMLLEQGQQILTMLVQGLIIGIPLLTETILNILNQITIWIQTELPKFVEQGTNMIVKLIEGITLAIPQIIEVAVQIINALSQGFATYFPLLVTAGVDILSKLIEGIATALPMLIEAGIQILTGLINSIVDMLPMLIDAGLQILTALVDAIVVCLPLLITAGLSILEALANAIINNLPLIIDAGLKILLALADAIINNLPKIIDAGMKIVNSLVEGINKIMPQLMQAGITLVVTLAGAILQNLPKILQAGVQLAMALIKGVLQLLASIAQAGVKLVITLVTSVIQNAPKMLQAGMQLVQAILQGIASLAGSLLNAGRQIVSNILSGIKSAWGSVTSWVSSSLSKLNPFGKGKSSMNFEVTPTMNTKAVSGVASQLSQFGTSLTSNPILSQPSHFGFTGRSGLFNLGTSLGNSHLGTTKQSNLGRAKDIVVNTIVELDGYQIAKATARHMQEEISNIERKANRLGGVL